MKYITQHPNRGDFFMRKRGGDQMVVKDWYEVRDELQGKAIKAIDDSGFHDLDKEALKTYATDLWGKRKCCKKILEHDGDWNEDNEIEISPGCMVTREFLADAPPGSFEYLKDRVRKMVCCEKSTYYYPVGRKFTEEDINRWLEEDNMDNWNT